MSDQTAIQRPSAPPPARGGQGLVFFDLSARKAAFEYRLEDDGPYYVSPSVMGFFQAFWLEWDKGRESTRQQERIEPRWKLRVLLVDAQTEDMRPAGRAWVTVGPKSAFYGLAHGLLSCKPGDFVGVRVAEGDNACFVDVSTWDGQSWSGRQTPKSDGREFADRYEETVELLKASASYKEPERRTQGEGQPAAAAPVQTSAATPVAQPTQETAAEAAEPDEVAPNPLPTAFRIQATRWVKSFAKEPSERQMELVREKLKPLGIETPAAVRSFAEAILKAYAAPLPVPGAPLKSGHYTLVYDWLGAATDDAKENAKIAAGLAHDPFADE